MSYDSKSKQVDKTEGKVSFLERLIHGKGTVAEPWPTAEELWNNPEVKKIIDAHNQSVRQKEVQKDNKLAINWRQTCDIFTTSWFF